MRRYALAIAAAVLLATAAQAQTLVTPIDQSISVTFPAAARDIVVGNPRIVDVNLVDARNAVLIGKSFGVTSVQVFDTAGRSIYARQIVVSSADDNRVSYFRGGVETSFACAPRCERTGGEPAASAAPATPALTPAAP